MNRIVVILVFALAAVMGAGAQGNLNINTFFGEKYIEDPSVSMTRISGDQPFLKSNHLNLIATFKGNAEKFAPLLSPMVIEDGRKATGRNVHYKHGELQYAFYILNDNRYIYYIKKSDVSKPYVLLIYMEGDKKLDSDKVLQIIKSLSK